MIKINQTTIFYYDNISPKGCKLASQVDRCAFSTLDRLYYYWIAFDTNFNDCTNSNVLFETLDCLLVYTGLRGIPH
jgi:hypothetical protein